MSLKSTLCAAVAAISLSLPALAQDIMVDDAYARVSTKASKSGAAFMMLHNMSDSDDRLINATSDVSKRVELHTHEAGGDGVMRMIHVEEGFALPAGETHALARGGDHVMFMGLNRPLEHGDVVTVTLEFEKAGLVTVEIPVDLERKPEHGKMQHGHGKMKAGATN